MIYIKDIKDACVKFELSNEDLNRLSINNIEEMISSQRSQLNIWSISGNMKNEIQEEIKYLEILLKYAEKNKKKRGNK